MSVHTGVPFGGVYTHWIRRATLILCREVASLQRLQSELSSPPDPSLPGTAYLEHDNLQHQPARLLRTGVRAARALLHTAVWIGTRAAGMVRAVAASAVERFQAVGQ
jgi:hypothetical protein